VDPNGTPPRDLDYTFEIWQGNARRRSFQTPLQSNSYQVDESYIGELRVVLIVTDPDHLSARVEKPYFVRGSDPRVTLFAAGRLLGPRGGGDSAYGEFGLGPYIKVPFTFRAQADDPDGGTITAHRWWFSVVPPGASVAANATLGTTDQLVHTFTPADMTATSRGTALGPGHWELSYEATDNEHAKTRYTTAFHMLNQVPALALTKAPADAHTPVGVPVIVTVTGIADPDGGPIDLAWDLLQAPLSDGSHAVSPWTEMIFDSATAPASVSFPGDLLPAPFYLTPGHWIFGVSATDDEGETVTGQVDHSPNIVVLVDAPPVAAIEGPDTATSGEALTLHSASYDPDDGLHDRVAGPADLGAGVKLAWSVIVRPDNDTGLALLGPVGVALGLPENGDTLDLSGLALEPGTWRFALHVSDAEGNATDSEHEVIVDAPNLEPEVVLEAPRRYTVENGALLEPVVVDGGASYDPDEDPATGSSDGLGITLWRWTVTPPIGCDDGAGDDDGPTRTIYQVGDAPRATCHGRWTLALEVTDNDVPTAKTASAETSATIGDCQGELCIDAPTHAQPQAVRFAESTDVVIDYHIDSALYDRPEFALGMSVGMTIAHHDVPWLPVYFASDLMPATSNKGDTLELHWDGRVWGQLRPPPGKYDVKLQLSDGNGAPYGEPALEAEAVHIEVADLVLSPVNDPWLDWRGVHCGTPKPHTFFGLTSATLVASVHWSVSVANQLPFAGGDLPASLFSAVPWDGCAANVPVAPGDYVITIDALRADGARMASAIQSVTVYRMSITTTGETPASAALHPLVVVNDDDDNWNGVVDHEWLFDQSMAGDADAPHGEDDLVELHATFEPARAATMALSRDAGILPALRLWNDGARGSIYDESALAVDTSVGLTRWLEGVAYHDARVVMDVVVANRTFTLEVPCHMVDLTLVGASAASEILPLPGANGDPVLWTNIARWDWAYGAPPNASGTLPVLNDALPLTNFVELDPRRFYVHVRDSDGDTNHALAETRTVTVETLTSPHNPAPGDWRHTDPDPPTVVPMIESDVASADFMSVAQLLTTQDLDYAPGAPSPPLGVADDKLEAHAGPAWVTAPNPPGPVADEALGDRTHMAEIDGSVRVVYTPAGAGATKQWDFPVSRRGALDERRRVPVQVHTFLEPYHDVGCFDATGQLIGAGLRFLRPQWQRHSRPSDRRVRAVRRFQLCCEVIIGDAAAIRERHHPD